MQLTKLYISPHFDDAVFSCAGKIIENVKNGDRVVVATVFTGCSDMHSEDCAKRSLENNKALEILGAEGFCLAYRDAPFRQTFYHSFQHIVLERHPRDDENFVRSIGASLNQLCKRIHPHYIYSPLGVGTHIDHRLTFEAVTQHLNAPIIYYEDRPYAYTTHAVSARLNELGVQSYTKHDSYLAMSQSKIAEYLASLSSMPYVKEYLPGGALRDSAYALIAERMSRKFRIRYLGASALSLYPTEYNDLILNSALAYATQIANFFGSIENVKALTHKYSNQLSTSQCLAERYWTLNIPDGAYDLNSGNQKNNIYHDI